MGCSKETNQHNSTRGSNRYVSPSSLFILTTNNNPTGLPDDSGRPASSLSSLPLSTTSSHHDDAPPSRPVSPRSPRQNGGGGWFFRASDAFQSSDSAPLESPPPPPTRVAAASNKSASNSNLPLRGQSRGRAPRASMELERDNTVAGGSSRTGSKGGHTRTPSRSRTPFSVPGESVNVNGAPETPSKLLKRRSLGFVVRRTLTGLGNGHGDGGQHGGLDGLRVESRSPPVGGGQPRHASYGAVSTTKSGAASGQQFKAEEVFQDRRNLDFEAPSEEGVRGRKKTLVKGRKQRPDSVDVDKVQPQPQDAGRSFIRSVRRISIVGRHKRQKSGTTVPLALGRPSLGSQPESTTFPVQEDVKKVSVQGLLPPAEIQPSPEPQELLATLDPQVSSPSPPQMETEVIYQTEDSDSHIIKPSLPQTPRKTDDPRTPPMSPKRSIPRSPTSPAKSPQSASLGRSAYSPTRKSASPEEKTVLRRNSLGDLKIPARISQAQVGIRRDLGMVRDFAQNVERTFSSFLFYSLSRCLYSCRAQGTSRYLPWLGRGDSSVVGQSRANTFALSTAIAITTTASCSERFSYILFATCQQKEVKYQSGADSATRCL